MKVTTPKGRIVDIGVFFDKILDGDVPFSSHPGFRKDYEIRIAVEMAIEAAMKKKGEIILK